jgi:hypothetical protein
VFCTDGDTAASCPASGAESYGQDGNVRIDVPAYDFDALAVVDPVTHLVWQTEAQPQMTTADAAKYCDDLVLAGSPEWRLPTMLELLSIVDFGRTDPSIDEVAFPGTPSSCFKTSTPAADGAASSWEVCFGDGTSYAPADTEAGSVRCVQGALPEQAFAIEGEIVSDPRTGLVWQKGGFWEDATVDNKTWIEALEYCRGIADANLGGHDDWRLPSIKELGTLVDPAASGINIDLVAFPGTPGRDFWSSTPTPKDPQGAYVIYFDDGCVNQAPTVTRFAVRCVRGP